MYIPSFTEIVLLLIVVIGWSRWLTPRVPAARWVPYVAGSVVLGGVAFGALAVVAENTQQVLWSRWAALLTCLGSMAVLGSWTVLNAGKPTPGDDPPG